MLILTGPHKGDNVALVSNHVIGSKSATGASVLSLDQLAARDAIFKAVPYFCETGVAH